MIDLHCHLLPGIDDGARDLETALAMARIATDDGIEIVACTPHIYPGLYDNNAEGIRNAIAALHDALRAAGNPLKLTVGADTHLVPEVVDGLRTGRIPSLNATRYLLLEPPHHVAPPRFEMAVSNVRAAGYVPLITHPERLSWIEDHYEKFVALAHDGVWMQVTAGAVTGRFGRRPRYWAERMLDEGLVHVLATDAHNTRSRPPLLAEGEHAASAFVGAEEARRMVVDRPLAVLRNAAPDTLPAPPGLTPDAQERSRARAARGGLFRRWFGG